MDSHGESSALESLGDCEVSPERAPGLDHSDIRSNGSCDNIDLDESGMDENCDARALAPDSIEKGKEITEPNTSPPSTAQSPSGGSSSARKGYGLKKWRRIRRDFVKDGSAQLDSSKILKRGLNGLGNQNNSSRFSVERASVEVMKESEGSVGSTSVTRNLGLGHADGPAVHASTLESNFAAAPAFTAGADSDNSEDRSSKSSTAASAPKAKHDFSAAFGYVRERNRIKNLSGKSQGGSSQHAQQNKGRIELSKKPRGERVKIQKENSHSSVESDLRSSSSVFMQGAYASNGQKSGRAMNYYSANSDEAHMGDDHFSEEIQTGYPTENVGEADDFSQDDSAVDLSWEAGEEKHKSNRSSADHSTLIESINALQSLQEALEQEVQKFSEIGGDPALASNGTSNGGTVLQEQSDLKHFNQNASGKLEIQILSLTENVKILEAKLEETRAELKVKESRVSELEDSTNSRKSVKEEPESTLELQREECREMETELEGLFKQKIEAEVEYLAIARTIQKLKVDAQSLMLLNEGDDQRASESEAESKAAALKKQADDLVKACEDIEVAGEVWKLQRGACKVSSCFVIQLVLFVLVFWCFILQISPQVGEVVPT